MILSKSYHEIMEKIEVTDEMRTHITLRLDYSGDGFKRCAFACAVCAYKRN